MSGHLPYVESCAPGAPTLYLQKDAHNPYTPACYPSPPEIYLRRDPPTIASLFPNPPQHNSQCICFPNAFSPCGGAKEWKSNELLLKDECMRKIAGVTPLDCDITDLYYINPIPKL